jgi:predicted ferric reductase
VSERHRTRLRPTSAEVAFWFGAYGVLALLPLAVVLVAPTPPARGFWIEFAVALGFVALAMLGLQFALTARFRQIAGPFGIDTLLHFHRQAGLLAFALALAHPIILITAHRPWLAFLDPRVEPLRALALWAVVGALVLLIALTLWRKPLGLAYEWWRASHGLLALLVVFIGLVHVMRVGYYVAERWQQAVWIATTGGAMLLLLYARLVRPLQMRRAPYRVTEVLPERGRSWTLVLVPDGHAGLRFRAGQFVWLTLGPTPFSLQQHPFSIASSDQRPERLELTIRELGDFTATMGSVTPGTRAFLEGPYGAFTIDPDAAGAVFIAAGVGITPVMSILRSLRDRGDRRPLTLIYANTAWDDVIFREELADLATALALRVVHLLEQPPAQWNGAVGRVSDALLDAHLPPTGEAVEYFVCGPGAMMDVAERVLLERGVPLRRLKSERFDIA